MNGSSSEEVFDSLSYENSKFFYRNFRITLLQEKILEQMNLEKVICQDATLTYIYVLKYIYTRRFV